MKILIADDHQILLEGLATILSQNIGGCYIDKASNIKTLKDLLEKTSYDVLIQDIKFGNENAMYFLGEIRRKYPNIKILILSSVTEKTIITNLLEKADAYIVKSEPLEIILQAIQKITSGKDKFLSPETRKIVNIYHRDEVVLTRREREVLQELLREKSTKEIASSLNVSIKTVEMHRSNLLLKFNVKNAVGLVKKAIELDVLGG